MSLVPLSVLGLSSPSIKAIAAPPRSASCSGDFAGVSGYLMIYPKEILRSLWPGFSYIRASREVGGISDLSHRPTVRPWLQAVKGAPYPVIPFRETPAGMVGERLGSPVICLECADLAMPGHVHDTENIGALLQR